MFRNNANLSDGVDRRQNQNCFMEMVNVSGLYDYMMHVGTARRIKDGYV